MFLVSVAGGAAGADQGGLHLVVGGQPRRVRSGVDGGECGGGQPRPGHRPGVDSARGRGGLVGQRQDLTHHVHVVRYQQRDLQDLRLGRLEEKFLRLCSLRAGYDEHEVVLAAAEGDDVGVGEPVRHLHGVVLQHGDSLLVDGQPGEAPVNLALKGRSECHISLRPTSDIYLDLEQRGPEELPLPGAGEEDPHTVRARLA